MMSPRRNQLTRTVWTLTIFDFTPAIDLTLYLDMGGLCCVLDREVAFNQSQRYQVRLACQDRPLECCGP
jgi:hypothetical protein